MGQNGGARPGAGRKKKSEKFETQIQRAEKKIADKLPLLVDKALELAEGVLSEEFNLLTMKKSVYQKPPDLGAIKYLVDRIMGKPTERQELSGPDGGSIPVQFFDYDTATTKLTAGSEDDSETPSRD
jgi:hypothetical protein